MPVRFPSQAGAFYEASADRCRDHARKLLSQVELPDDLPDTLYGGLVPHAGWSFSGQLAAQAVEALTRGTAPSTVILFGADHVGVVRRGEVFDRGAWKTPLGECPVDETLAQSLLNGSSLLRANPNAHEHEHSLEVIVPLLQLALPEASILPIAVPPTELAGEIGLAVGQAVADRDANVRFLGSTDLTHHGGGRFPAPGGRGDKGEQWTAENDRRMLDLIEQMKADQVVDEAREHHNACGAGAIAATIAACRQRGATRGRVLEYTNSYRIVHERYPYELDDTTVGYASVVFI